MHKTKMDTAHNFMSDSDHTLQWLWQCAMAKTQL